jgi:hypothetical protein
MQGTRLIAAARENDKDKALLLLEEGAIEVQDGVSVLKRRTKTQVRTFDNFLVTVGRWSG